MNSELSTRLFWQAGVTAVFAPFAATGGKGWVLLVLMLAAAAGGLGAYLRLDDVPGRLIVIGFEGVAVLFGVLALLGDHYVPGSIVGAVTLVVALRAPSVDLEPTAPLSVLVPVQSGRHHVSYTPIAVGAGTFPALVAAAAPAGHSGATLTAAPAVASTASGQWAPDPTGRNHYRWWDGTAWTEHVSTHGATGVDALR